MNDSVNHPHYYNGKFECIDVMQDTFGDVATINFCLLNSFKYVWRAGKKPDNSALQDLKKARWYLSKALEILDPKTNETD